MSILIKSALTLFLLLSMFRIVAQPNPEYFERIKQAKKYFHASAFDSAASAYTYAFQVKGGAMRGDRYNAAESYAMSGSYDLAFEQLTSLTKADWSLYDSLISDRLLSNLHKDKRWEIICAKVKSNAGLDDAKLNKYAKNILDTVLRDDQEGRNKLIEIEKSSGYNSEQYKALSSDIIKKDSINILKVLRIIDSFGWLGKDVVGEHGYMAEFLVIQHAPLSVQKKYLPILRKAARAGKLNTSFLATLEDRILISEGKDQVYGTQIARASNGEYFVEPLSDPDNVDIRRQSVGLNPMANYLKDWKIEWDVSFYKKNIDRNRQFERELNNKKNE